MDGMPRSRVFSAGTVDGLLCGALLVVGQSQVWAGWNDGGVGVTSHDHQLARAVLAVAFVLPLWWRRSWPLLAVGVICAAIAVQVVVVTPYVPFVAGLLPMSIANYTCAAYAPRLRGVGLLAVLGAELVIYAAIPEERVPGEVLFSIFVALGTWVAGDVVRVRSERAERALGTARTIIAEREAANSAALADERARIARELHDVIAHSVSVMGVQAGAARLLLEHDPASARTAMLAIEDTARTSVAELQRLLAVLRADDTPGNRSPTPGLHQLPALVEQVRSAGLPVEVTTHGLGTLPLGVDLAAYRILQEALTNALKHAAARTVVDVRRLNGRLDIEVRNGAPRTRPERSEGGHGLVGMRERVQLYGGTLSAQPLPDGGFVVHATLPAGDDTVTGTDRPLGARSWTEALP